MSRSFCRTFPRTTLVAAFVLISTLMQLQTVVDLTPAPTATPATSTATNR